MKKQYRVKTRQDFQMIFKQGQSCANRKFVVYALDREKRHFRAGLSVSKKLGKAVTRNTIKRRLRHLLQELSPNLKTQDLVVIARKGVEDLTFSEMRRHLTHVLKLADLYEEDFSEQT